jgi:hypothetical protein
VDIQKRGGKFVEDEDRGIVVYKRSLVSSVSRGHFWASSTGNAEGTLTKPKLNTVIAERACNNMPTPNILRFVAVIHKSHRKYPTPNDWIKPVPPV